MKAPDQAEGILVHPDPRLRQKARPVEDFGPELIERCRWLEGWMRRGPGGVGIAAPQLGWSARVVVVDCRESRRPCEHHGLLFLVNPVIHRSSGRALGREGCLSVPDWVGMVPRAREIEVAFITPEGKPATITARGFEARVIQHEVDHLDGILFIDRVVSTRDLVRRMAADEGGDPSSGVETSQRMASASEN